MSDAPAVKTRRVTRDKLKAVFGSHELIKVFEDIIDDVTVTLPDAVGADADDADTVLKAASFSRQPAPAPVTNDDASAVMSAQFFARPAAVVAPRPDDQPQVMAAQLFARQTSPVPTAPDTASAILASQIFGA